jgi:CheY-like chemotaxis protein
MNSSDFLLQLLPTARCYARTLSGSQEAGDELVAAVFETGPNGQVWRNSVELKVAFFQQISDAWSDLFADLAPDEQEGSDRAALKNGRIGQLSSVRRQVYLLVTIASFSINETACIVRLSVNDVTRELSLALDEIATQPPVKVLIIEDELFVASHLEEIVIDQGHRVVGIAKTHSEAVVLFHNEQPDLILADVHLADRSSGIEAVSEIVSQAPLPIIFITAYPELLLTGLRPEPTFLIAKPFRAEQVRASIGQAVFFLPHGNQLMESNESIIPNDLGRWTIE